MQNMHYSLYMPGKGDGITVTMSYICLLHMFASYVHYKLFVVHICSAYVCFICLLHMHVHMCTVQTMISAGLKLIL